MPRIAKSILSSTLFLLLLFHSSTLPLLAAGPSASLRLSPDKHFIYVTFSGLTTVSKVSYTLVYSTSRGEKGFEGGFKNPRKVSRSTRRQILGTCSSGKCVYHTNPHGFVLEVTYILKNGSRTTSTFAL